MNQITLTEVPYSTLVKGDRWAWTERGMPHISPAPFRHETHGYSVNWDVGTMAPYYKVDYPVPPEPFLPVGITTVMVNGVKGLSIDIRPTSTDGLARLCNDLDELYDKIADEPDWWRHK